MLFRLQASDHLMDGTAVGIAKAAGNVHHAFATEPDAQSYLDSPVCFVRR